MPVNTTKKYSELTTPEARKERSMWARRLARVRARLKKENEAKRRGIATSEK